MDAPVTTIHQTKPASAIVNGQSLEQLPEDLYIPPDALEVYLETFEGPLDLLLYLIKRQNLDILEISIAKITNQYMTYIETMNEMRMEIAAEYLLMAALLAEIKSRMLLPRQAHDDDDEEDPRAELIRRLQEYEIFKKAAENFDDLPRLERDLFQTYADTSQLKVNRLQPQVARDDILIAMADVLKRVEQFNHHHIQRELLSVRERMSQILECLQESEWLSFFKLFRQEEGKPGAVVSLLAVLELSKEGLIELIQLEPLAEITIRPVKV